MSCPMNRSLETFTTPEETTLHGQLTTDVLERDHSKFVLKQKPAHGITDINEQGAFSYTPNEGFTGIDQFVVEMLSKNKSHYFTVFIHVTPVQDEPDLQETTVITSENTSIRGSLVKKNHEKSSKRFSLASSPRNGSVILSEDGSYVYTPTEHFRGSDSFTIFVSEDSTCMEEVTVNVTITSHVNKLPARAPGTSLREAKNTLDSPSFQNVRAEKPVKGSSSATFVQPAVTSHKTTKLQNPIKAGSQITVTETGLSVFGRVRSRHRRGLRRFYQLLTPPANGTAQVKMGGTFLYDPNPGFVGNDCFTVRISDRIGNSLITPVFITVQESEEE